MKKQAFGSFLCGYSFGSPFCDTCSIQGQCPNHNNAHIKPKLIEYQEFPGDYPFCGDCPFCGGRN